MSSRHRQQGKSRGGALTVPQQICGRLVEPNAFCSVSLVDPWGPRIPYPLSPRKLEAVPLPKTGRGSRAISLVFWYVVREMRFMPPRSSWRISRNGQRCTLEQRRDRVLKIALSCSANRPIIKPDGLPVSASAALATIMDQHAIIGGSPRPRDAPGRAAR